MIDILKWVFSHIYNFISGIIALLIGYLAPLMVYLEPLEKIITVMMIAIAIDFILGVIASLKEGRGIKSRRLMRTLYKVFFASVLISLVYSIDTEMGMIELHKVIAWVFSGFELWSILENLARLSNLKIFKSLQKIMSDTIQDKIGVDISDVKHNV